MWPFRKKIIVKETKHYSYRRRHDTSNYSIWDGMSFIEQFAMVTLPIMLCFIFYMIGEAIFGFVWWVILPISIGITAILIALMTWLMNWIMEKNWS